MLILRYLKTKMTVLNSLQNFVLGYEDWKILSCTGKAGKLSSQTFASLIHTTKVIPKIINHLTSDECGFSYVLTGFLQNDSLEKHFGVYRLMSGCQYNISFCQILESERRIKIGFILKLYQAQDGKYESSLKEFVRSFSVQPNTPVHQSDLSIYSPLLHENFDFSPTMEIRQTLAFIGGYAVHNIYKNMLYSKKSKPTSYCKHCVSLLTEVECFSLSCEESDLTLIHLADRGGLKYPSSDVISAVTIQWQILVILEQNPALFSHFISESDKSILIQLAMSRIEFVGFEFWRDKCPDCQRPFVSYLAQIISATTNCLLKNKIRNLNSKRKLDNPKGSKKKLRKLQSK